MLKMKIKDACAAVILIGLLGLSSAASADPVIIELKGLEAALFNNSVSGITTGIVGGPHWGTRAFAVACVHFDQCTTNIEGKNILTKEESTRVFSAMSSVIQFSNLGIDVKEVFSISARDVKCGGVSASSFYQTHASATCSMTLSWNLFEPK